MEIVDPRCGCELHTEAGQVVRIDTCPVCLPVGSVTWLIENGRQLELPMESGVDVCHERDAPTDPDQINTLSISDREVLKSLKEGNHHGATQAARRED